jgi:uncharacterized membrane protein
MASFLSRSGPLSFLLALVLAVAGLVHLMEPGAFLPFMPPYLPQPVFLIYFTGVLELFAAVGLRSPGLRQKTAWWLVAYFVALWPVHFHVAANSIPVFGLASPAFLWGRTAFQIVFIAWAAWIALLARREGLGPVHR